MTVDGITTAKIERYFACNAASFKASGFSTFNPASDEVIVGTNNDKEGYIATVSDKTGFSISGTKTTLDALNDISLTDVAQALADGLAALGDLAAATATAVWGFLTRALTSANTDETPSRDMAAIGESGATLDEIEGSLVIAKQDTLLAVGEAVLTIPTGTLLSDDPRLPETVIASSLEVAKDDTVMKAGDYVAPLAPQEIRDAMKLAPSEGDPGFGSIDDRLVYVTSGIDGLQEQFDQNLVGMTQVVVNDANPTKLSFIVNMGSWPSDDFLGSMLIFQTGLNQVTGREITGFEYIDDNHNRITVDREFLSDIMTGDIAFIKTGACNNLRLGETAKEDTLLTAAGAIIQAIPTAEQIDGQFTANHGSGSWADQGGSAPTVEEIDAHLTEQHGEGSWNSAGSIILPVMQGEIYTATAMQGREVRIKRGDTPRITFDLGTACTGWTGRFGAKKTLSGNYVIGPKNISWIDASKGQGYVDLDKTDTNHMGEHYAEIEIVKDEQTLTAMEFTLNLLKDVIT